MSVKNWLARITRFIISILIYKFHIFIAEYISFVHQDLKQRFFSLRYVQLKKKVLNYMIHVVNEKKENVLL